MAVQSVSETKRTNRLDAANALRKLRAQGFIGNAQAQALGIVLRGEERQFFQDKVCDIAALVTSMPKTYEQDGKGDQAIVHLHYFASGLANWYITERDQEPEQLQAYGMVNLGYGDEKGYISLLEITNCGAELDLYWTPKTLKAVQS